MFQTWAKRLASDVVNLEMNMSYVTGYWKKERDALAGQFAFDPNLEVFVTDINSSAIAYHRGLRDMALYLRERLEQDMRATRPNDCPGAVAKPAVKGRAIDV